MLHNIAQRFLLPDEILNICLPYTHMYVCSHVREESTHRDKLGVESMRGQ